MGGYGCRHKLASSALAVPLVTMLGARLTSAGPDSGVSSERA
jgi:hypothetical protein